MDIMGTLNAALVDDGRTGIIASFESETSREQRAGRGRPEKGASVHDCRAKHVYLQGAAAIMHGVIEKRAVQDCGVTKNVKAAAFTVLAGRPVALEDAVADVQRCHVTVVDGAAAIGRHIVFENAIDDRQTSTVLNTGAAVVVLVARAVSDGDARDGGMGGGDIENTERRSAGIALHREEAAAGADDMNASGNGYLAAGEGHRSGDRKRNRLAFTRIGNDSAQGAGAVIGCGGNECRERRLRGEDKEGSSDENQPHKYSS